MADRKELEDDDARDAALAQRLDDTDLDEPDEDEDEDDDEGEDSPSGGR